MKKYFSIILLIVFSITFTYICFADGDIEKKSIIPLSKYDGLNNTITGPFGIEIPKTFFTKDKITNIKDSGCYYAFIENNLLKKDSYLVLYENEVKNIDEKKLNGRAPVVITIRFLSKNYRNYIIPFGSTSKIKVSIGKEISELIRTEKINFVEYHDLNQNDAKFLETTVKVAVFSEDLFLCKIETEESSEKIIINTPNLDDKEALNTDKELFKSNKGEQNYGQIDFVEYCCYVTGNGSKRKAWITNLDSQIGIIAWIKMVMSGTVGPYSVDADGYLSVYYPSESDEIHTADYSNPVECMWRSGLGWATCYKGFDDGFTTIGSACDDRSEYLWYDMSYFIWIREDSSSAYVKSLSGCDAGTFWSVKRVP